MRSRSADVKVKRCGTADVKVRRCGSAGMKVRRCRPEPADVKVRRCGSAGVKGRRCRPVDVLQRPLFYEEPFACALGKKIDEYVKMRGCEDVKM